VDLCYDVFWKLYPHFPDDELELVDLTLRMFCQPVFQIDKDLVTEELNEQLANKMRTLLVAGCRREDVLSNAKFVAMVQAAGGYVAQKVSKATGKYAPALAKTDEGLKQLLNSDIPKVRALAEARVAVKSTIGETRAQRFLDTAEKGSMPVLLNYYGAHTGRWSGGDKMNMQNLPRPNYLPNKEIDPTTGRLRRSLRAPKGKQIVVADSGQIEARVNAWLAGQHDVLDIFRAYDIGEGPDLYKVMAAALFNVPLDEVTKDQRFIGKVVTLACGYGMGANKLLDTLANAKPTPVYATHEQAAEWIDTYRRVNNKIKRSWKHYQGLLPRMTLKTCEVPVGPLTLVHEAVRLPNGLFIRYPDLKVSQGDWENSVGEASFAGRNGVRTKLYGGLLCENFVQALSRCIIAEQMLTLSREGIRILTTTHDEIVALSSNYRAEKTYRRMLDVMSTPPEWAQGLPLAADGGFAENYSK
jgi:DNA polymerase